jgi:hypothetical protein
MYIDEKLYDLLDHLNVLNEQYNKGYRTLEACKDCGSTTGSQLAIISIIRRIEDLLDIKDDPVERKELGLPETIPDTMKWYI